MNKSYCHRIQEGNVYLSEDSNEFSYTNRDASASKNSKYAHPKFILQQDNDSQSSSSSSRKMPSKFRLRQKNKQCARKSRLKKRKRIQQLENRERQLREQLSRYKSQNLQAKFQVEKFLSRSDVPIIFNNIGRIQAYQRLNEICESKNILDEDQINLIIDNLRSRVSAKGTERQGKINYIFKQVIDICFPTLHRYFIWNGSNSSQYFREQQTQTYGVKKDILRILNLTQSQKEVIKGKKNNFENHYQIFFKYIQKMKQIKEQIQKQSWKVEDLIEQMRHIINPIQSAKLLTLIESNKYKGEMEFWVSQNIRRFSWDMQIPHQNA